MPLLSVVVPIYGVEKYIERCVKSLFEQTLKDIEFIFVDDCTPDRSIEILYRIIEEYRTIINDKNYVVRIERMPTNSGLPAVRRRGIQLCTGDYIIHCDSDDWIDLTMYENLYRLARQENADIVYCHYYLTDGCRHQKQKDIQPPLMQGPLWNKMIKRDLYDEIWEYPQCNKAEDGAYMTQLSFISRKTILLNQYLYFYFQNPLSICGNITKEACLKKLDQEKKNTELRIRFLASKNCLEQYKQDVIKWKVYTRDNLNPLLSEKDVYKIWINTYPEINYQYFFQTCFSVKQKVFFALRLLRFL